MSAAIIDREPVPAPAPRVRVKRLTRELKELPVGGSFLADVETARCYVEYGRRNGFSVVQKKESDGKVRIWRRA